MGGAVNSKIKNMIQEARDGDSEIQVALGWLYHEGREVKKSFRKSFYWTAAAALSGINRIVYYNLSIAYSLGRGVKRNDYKAFLWAKRAAEMEYEDAMLAVAWFYFNGMGTVQNSCKAQEWYEKILAINPRNVSALFSLGQIYFFRREYDDAREYFHKAYKINQHVRACYYLGRLFLEKQ
ncbi:sel1 repeat family protein [Victivallis vadensis]|uniref:Sel1 repeat family protein n=1 Tax=Victivallis vadensis TaxID=172901 RepID=A0A848AWF7_9BACT|nr:tetratricopeptide repeat protein [Victivallis vadensis]NMD88044.1 sel1 repeat family protein [Victivallis vadensis]